MREKRGVCRSKEADVWSEVTVDNVDIYGNVDNQFILFPSFNFAWTDIKVEWSLLIYTLVFSWNIHITGNNTVSATFWMGFSPS